MADKEKKKYPWNKIIKRRPGPALTVYAGPEYFAKKNKPQNEPGAEQPASAEFEGVYAGPEPPVEVKNGPPYDPSQFMAVYAGPEFFSGPDSRPAGAFAPVPNGPDEPCLKTYCPQCGKEISPFDKKCGACGYEFERICSSCGAACPSSSKFCPECGTPADK